MDILKSSEIVFFIFKKAHGQVFTNSSIGGQMLGSKIPSDSIHTLILNPR